MRDVYYFQQISDNKGQLIFKVPWGGAILRNCFSTGQLFKIRAVKEYEVKKKEINRQLWLFLPLKVFRNQDTLYGVYCCPQCETMAGTDQLSIDQDPIQIASRVCEHSKVCSTILDDWRTVWDITILPEDRIVQINCNEDIRMHTFQHSSKENTLLAAVRSSDEVALLYTVTSRQGTPLCSLCTVRNCRHAYSYDNHKDEDISNFLSTVNTGGEPFESNLLSQAGSAPAPHQSHQEDLVAQPDDANVDGSSESEYGSENDYVPTNGERGKNPNYWVSIAF